MADRRVSVKFSAEVENYRAALAAAAKSTDDLKKSADAAGKVQEQSGAKADVAAKKAADSAAKHKDALENVGKAATIGGAAVLAGVGMAVKSYADFDKQMSAVDAATHESTGNMGLLREAAIKAGADTAFSAGEAAKGIEELAKAGVSTKDILGGGLNGSLALAAAGSLDVGTAAEIAASALTQFKLSGDKVPHVADLLAAGAGKAQGSVADLGAALNQSGLVAASTGLTIEETTGSLAAFASAGLTGSDAGTSFKTMLMSLNPNSKEAAALMDKLGIHAYDAQGKFIGMSEYAGVLQNALKGMSDEQRNATLKTLFGSDAVRAANVLYEQGAAGITDWTNKVNDAGYAADTAARMQNNLAGDVEKLGGSFDTALIQSGSGANEVLRGVVQGLTNLVNVVSTVPAPVLGVATGFAAVIGGGALLAGGLLTVIPKIQATREAMELLAPAGSKANDALSKTGRIAAGAATGLAAVAAASAIAGPALDKILAPTGETGDALEAFGGQAAKGAVGADTLNKSFQDLVQGREGVGAFQSAIEGIADPGVWGNIDNVVVGGIKILSLGMADVTSTSDKARERMKALGEQLASVDADKASKSFQDMSKATNGSQDQLKQLLDLMPAYRKTLEDQAKASGKATDDQTLLDIAMGKIKTSTDGAATAAGNLADKAGQASPITEALAKDLESVGLAADGSIVDIDKFGQSLFNAGLLSLSASGASIAYQDAIDKMTESVKTNGTTLDINTEKGRANQTAFNGIASAAITSAEAHAKETLSTQGSAAAQAELQGALGQSYNDLVTAAGQLGITGDAADTLARKALGVPKNVNLDSWIADHASATLDGIKAKADAVDGRVINTYANFHETTFIDTVRSDSGPNSGQGTSHDGSRSAYAVGGRIPGYADGGQLPTTGPGTGMTDGFVGISSAGVPIARVDAGEWVINRGSSGRYNRELAAINAGTFPKLPGFASGGMFPAQSFASPVGGGPSAPVAMTGTLVMDSGEVLGVFRGVATQVTRAELSNASRGSSYQRGGVG